MADSRRIVLVGPMYPYRGGIAHLSETMAACLLDRGHKVHAITFTRQYPALLFPGRTQYETGTMEERAVEAERLIDTINPFSWWIAARRIQELGAEVVIFRYWMPLFAPVFGTMARILARNNIKSLVVVDNALPHERRPGDVLLGRYFFRAMRGCVAMSSAVDRDLDQLGVSCSRALAPHPVYDSFGKPSDRAEAREKMGLAKDLPVILFFGFVRQYKGLHVLLESMPVVRDALPDVCLLVAGEFYDDEEPYQKKVEALDLQKQVQLVNQYIPKDEVADYFAAADVVVQPYLSATQSGVAQVAYQFEVPIITTDVGGLAEIVPHEEAGLIVPPNDAAALASAIVRYFVDDMRASLTAGVRRQKQSLGWDQLLDAIESVM